MSNLITISSLRGFIDESGVAQLNLEDVSRGLGFTNVAASGNECVRWNTVHAYLTNLGALQLPVTATAKTFQEQLPEFIPENIFYRLAMKAKNETAEKFQAKVADEILPAIRKTGSYSVAPTTKLEALAQTIQVLVEQEKAIKQLSATQIQQAEQLQGIRDVVALNPNGWRKESAALISNIALKLGGYEHIKDIRKEVYQLLDERFGVNLNQRLTNVC